MRPAVLIYNPAAGGRPRARRLAALRAALGTAGWETAPAATAGPGDATRLARRAAADGAAAVFALGGDGTLREAAAGLLGSGVPLGVLPAGTTNVLARAFGLPLAPLAAARALAGAEPRPLDVGLCGETPFLMMVSAGLDAAVLARLDPRLKAALGRAGIALQGLVEWWRYPYAGLELTADGAPRRASFAAVCNIPLYAGGFALAPGARWDDRRLELVTCAAAGRLATLGFALAVVRGGGRHLARSDVVCEPVAEVVLTGPPGTALQVDGDVCAEPLPVRLRLAAQPLAVLLPPDRR